MLLLLLLALGAAAIQVAPNSPCASVCLDSSTLDVSDPSASTTTTADLVCADTDLNTTAVGQTWSACLSCLQNSTYAQGSESDQAWLIYNLRYNFDYCIFGYPNASDVGTSPCQTSTACGQLQTALEYGIPTLGNTSTYAFCDMDGGVVTGSAYDQCLSCVSATEGAVSLANALVLLEAGCLQQPANDTRVSVSGSLFSSTVVDITDPATATTTAGAGSHRLATTTQAAIAIATIAGVVLVAAAAFVLYRKRRARRARRSGGFGTPAGQGGIQIDALGLGGGGIASPVLYGFGSDGGRGGGGGGGGGFPNLDAVAYAQPSEKGPLQVDVQAVSVRQLPPLSTTTTTTTATMVPSWAYPQQSPRSPPSAFTHTPRGRGSPTLLDSPAYTTPTSATALLGPSVLRGSVQPWTALGQPGQPAPPTPPTQSPPSHLTYVPATYQPGGFSHTEFSHTGFHHADSHTAGLGISTPPAASYSPPSDAVDTGALARRDRELAQQLADPRHKKKRGSGQAESAGGHLASTALQMDFPGPPRR